MERFDETCLTDESCNECVIAAFIRSDKLTPQQQEDLVTTAQAAQTLFLSGLGREQTVWQLARHPSNSGMTLQAITVAVDGAIMWYRNSCGIKENDNEGENNGEDF